MDTTTLHSVTEDLAAYLSEVTFGDLGRVVGGLPGDLGTMYLGLLDQNSRLAAALAGGPADLGQDNAGSHALLKTNVNQYGGCHFERRYRQTAHEVEVAFASVDDPHRLCRLSGLDERIDVASVFEAHIAYTVVHTWDVARVLGLAYRPTTEAAQRALRATAQHLLSGWPRALDVSASPSEPVDTMDAFERVLALSGRSA